MFSFSFVWGFYKHVHNLKTLLVICSELYIAFIVPLVRNQIFGNIYWKLDEAHVFLLQHTQWKWQNYLQWFLKYLDVSLCQLYCLLAVIRKVILQAKGSNLIYIYIYIYVWWLSSRFQVWPPLLPHVLSPIPDSPLKFDVFVGDSSGQPSCNRFYHRIGTTVQFCLQWHYLGASKNLLIYSDGFWDQQEIGTIFPICHS